MSDFDILVWGATGFTGGLVCEHILSHYTTSLKWAMGGRNRSKLEDRRKELSEHHTGALDVPILVADLNDKDSMFKLASSTKVLLSTAGPYSQLGTPVIRACIQAKTHYADINGELEWMRQIAEEFHEPALESGVKIVHSCGWDCAPADLGVLFLAQHTEAVLHRKLLKVTNLVTDIAGSFSGGTLNTALGFYSHPIKSLFPHPYSLNPPSHRGGRDGQQYLGPGYEPVSKHFTSPSLFAPADMRIVRRSNFLLGGAYGSDSFQFDEAFGHKSCLKAVKETLKVWLTGLFLLLVANVTFLTRWLKAKSLKPGEGPSRQVMEEGHWRCDLIGHTEEKTGRPEVVRAVLQGKGDPGYSQTSRMLLEAGLCLLKGKSDRACPKGGVLTPAAGLGSAFIDRIIATGIKFEILETDSQKSSQKAAQKLA